MRDGAENESRRMPPAEILQACTQLHAAVTRVFDPEHPEPITRDEFQEYLEWLKTPEARTSEERWQPRSRRQPWPKLTLVKGGKDA